GDSVHEDPTRLRYGYPIAVSAFRDARKTRHAKRTADRLPTIRRSGDTRRRQWNAAGGRAQDRSPCSAAQAIRPALHPRLPEQPAGRALASRRRRPPARLRHVPEGVLAAHFRTAPKARIAKGA